MSNASVDLPEPDTPVTTVNRSRGMSTSMLLRLCSRALWIVIALRARWRRAAWSGLPRSGSRTCGAGASGRPSAASYSLSDRPVCERS